MTDLKQEAQEFPWPQLRKRKEFNRDLSHQGKNTWGFHSQKQTSMEIMVPEVGFEPTRGVSPAGF